MLIFNVEFVQEKDESLGRVGRRELRSVFVLV